MSTAKKRRQHPPAIPVWPAPRSAGSPPPHPTLPKARTVPLRRQLLLTFLALSLGPFLLLTVLLYAQGQRDVTRLVQQTQAANLRTAISARNFAASALEAGLAAVADLDRDRGALSKPPLALHRRLIQLKARIPLGQNLLVVDRRGRVVSTADDFPDLVGLPLRDTVPGLAKTLATGVTTFGAPFRAPGLRPDPALAFSRPLHDRFGRVAGAAVITYGFSDYQRQLASARSRSHIGDLGIGDLLITDDQGRLVFCSTRPELAHQRLDISGDSPIRRAKSQGGAGIVPPYPSTLASPDHTLIAAYATLQPAGWIVVATSDHTALSAGPANQLRSLMMALIPVTLAAVAAAIWLSRRVASPLVALSDAVRDLPTGTFVAPPAVGSAATEYQTLVSALTEADHQLQARSEALAAQRQALESTVQERTAALQATNRIIGRLAGGTDLEHGLVEMLTPLAALAPFDHVMIYRYDAPTDSLDSVVQQPPDTVPLGHDRPLPVSVTAFAPAIRQGQPVIDRDLPATSTYADVSTLRHLGFHSRLVIPVQGPDQQVIGLLCLASRQTGTYDAAATVRLAPIGEQLGMAMTRGALVGGLEETLRRLQQLQEQLIRSDRLSAMGQLASTVTHEIKNRLNVIQAATTLIDMLAGRPDSAARIADTTAAIRREIDRGNTLMKTLLEFARPRPPKHESVCLAEVIDTTLAIARRANVTLERALPATLPPVSGDPALLEQVFLNLFLNALQAMPSGGRLSVTAAPRGPDVEVRVTDTGVGISPEDQAKLFHAFFTTKPTGTGLGLTITRQIIEQHQGSITCDSTVGKGTTFVLRLPQAASAPAPGPA